MTSCWVCPPTRAREMSGPNSAPSSAPPTKPKKLSDADDKALPVTGDRERGDNHDQDEVEHITAHDPNRIAFRPLSGASATFTGP